MLIAVGDTENIPGADLQVSALVWGLFLGFVAVLLLFDLFVLNRRAHEISLREAAYTSIFWVGLGLAFTFVIWATLGGPAAGQYITGYLIEKSLSVDNVFVWAVIFGYFAVPKQYQHRTLFWGIFGALVLRAAFIFAGIALLDSFSWMIFIFGGFLLFTAYRVATHKAEDIHPEKNPLLKLVRRILPITSDYHGQKFTVVEAGRRIATPLLVVLIMIEATDVIFALDSIPAVLAVTRSEFLVFTSNAMAILGLRALYFLLSGAAGRLVYLNVGLGVILGFVGLKMIVSPWIDVPIAVSLIFIAVVLTITVVISLRASPADDDQPVTD